METNKTPGEILQTASDSIRDGEARNLSARTMNKRWAAYFRAEDACKAQAGGWR